jgi:hypothetical protein
MRVQIGPPHQKQNNTPQCKWNQAHFHTKGVYATRMANFTVWLVETVRVCHLVVRQLENWRTYVVLYSSKQLNCCCLIFFFHPINNKLYQGAMTSVSLKGYTV